MGGYIDRGIWRWEDIGTGDIGSERYKDGYMDRGI